ncbi:MAG: FAD-dependent oxidoreductase [Chlamydiales bacterium]|nr:FAD-dependent oxidoreductase [Chlamydiales bacterium]
MINETDVLIIGAGIAGMIAAHRLAERGAEVTLLCSGEGVQASNSYRAQGGIAYEGGPFKEDILKAGDGLCFEEAVDQLVEKGPSILRETLIDLMDVPFEKAKSGKWKLTKEGAHSTARILYHGDQTGKAIMDKLYDKVAAHPKIALMFKQSVIDLITLSHHSKNPADLYQPSTCVGAYVLDQRSGAVSTFFAKETILATGGVGECFLHTTNGKEARGDGIAMAFRAGVRIMNMEYIQFHPTALYIEGEPRFLLTEALRGEGGKILAHDFNPCLDPMASRDIVARTMFQEMVKNDRPHLWLDLSHQNRDHLLKRFPAIANHCDARGFKFGVDPLPIVPAAHYSCGGISVDLEGRTTMRGLRAIGEVSCTGVHGANRLASTALLEGLVWGVTCGDSVELKEKVFPEVEPWEMGKEEVDGALIQQDWMTIKQTMWNYVGLMRSSHRLKRAHKMLTELKWEVDSFYEDGKLTPELLALRNGCETALLITQGALRNPYSQGTHFRVD